MPNHDVELRPFPYPYRAMLAICSDLDETPDRQVYWEIMRYLNTTRSTSIGPGLGLEVGNTIYFDMPTDQFSYWNTDDAGRQMVHALIHSGHVDCLHSYGDNATTRSHAQRALDDLQKHDCQLDVWIDHAVAPSNLGADIMRGEGDVPGSDAYHADLTVDFGVRYVWRGRVTSVIGQDTKRRLGGIFRAAHPLRSTVTLGKEWAKGTPIWTDGTKYAMHRPNRVLRPARLRDGRPVYEFLRCNPYWGGVENAATADGLAEVMTRRALRRLVERGGVCVFYTHLGKIRQHDRPFSPATRQALSRLAKLHHAGRLLVTTTRRLLGFCRATRDVSVRVSKGSRGCWIDLSHNHEGPDAIGTLEPRDLQGLTFYVRDPRSTHLRVDGQELEQVVLNPADHTGRMSVSIPWRPLEFPQL